MRYSSSYVQKGLGKIQLESGKIKILCIFRFEGKAMELHFANEFNNMA